MPDLGVQPLGPLFGPDFITLEVNDQTKGSFALEVFPDANNPSLKANGLAQQFYYLPKEIYLAKKEDSSGDFDFSVTLFKGLMTTEDTLGISGQQTSGGELDAGGAFVTFSTTMAVPDSVITAALAMLKQQQHDPPPPRIAGYFHRNATDPDPLLGIVPIADNNVTIEIPQLAGAAPTASAPSSPATPAPTAAAGGAPTAAAGTAAGAAMARAPQPAAPSTPAVVNNGSPWFISAQGTGHGSIEASGISSFLVTCNQLAAGAIVGALQAGRSPFTIHYNLTEMFYMNACQVQMHVDVDKTFMQLSGAAEAKYGGFFQADLQANYQSCLTSGAITTIINENSVAVDASLKSMIDKQVGDMQDKAWNLVKTEIFDWQPKADDPAKASAGACGGVAVSLKANYQTHGVHFDQSWTLNDTVTKLDTKSGTLTELQAAIQANLNKYLSIIDIGQYFQKLQVAATPNIDFSGQQVADPITAASIEVSYPVTQPDGTVSMAPDGTPTLKTLGDGFHYTPGNINLSAPSSLARWTKDNPNDIINISFMRLQKSLPNWNADQVKITKKLVYNPDDPRVDLSTNTPEITVVSTGTDHTPTVGPDDVGYVYVKFVLDRAISSNVTVTLTVTLSGSQGTRTDVLTLTSTDPKQKPVALWQVFSDKYFDADVAKVKIDVEVAPPPSEFAGTPVTWSGVQAVPVGLGRIKRIVPYTIQLPVLSDPAQQTLAGQYILEAQKELVTLS